MVNKNFIPVNKEEEYWFIRWVVMRRNYIKAVAELEQVKRIHAGQLAKAPLNLEIENKKVNIFQEDLIHESLFLTGNLTEIIYESKINKI